jgi:nucleoside-diphosphate-sugar epimerase
MSKSRKLFIVGGLSYLGFNIIEWYSYNASADIYVLARYKSIRRRPKLYNIVRSFPNVKIVSYPSFKNNYIQNSISRYGCPDILYNLVGTIIGDISNLYQSNAILPYKVIETFIKECEFSLAIHISSFYPSLSEASQYICEETPHLNKLHPFSHYEASKAFGELLMYKIYVESGGRIIILRPGLVIGAYPYHIEWLIPTMLANLKIGIQDGRPLPLTIAKDIAKVSEFLYSKNPDVHSFINWFYTTPYNISISDLQKILFRDGEILRLRIINQFQRILLPRTGFGEFLRSITRYKGAYYIPCNLIRMKFSDWTPLDEALTEMKLWLSNVSIVDSIKPFLT